MRLFRISKKGRAAALLGGIGVGATLMYLFDPGHGGRRRALIRDKAVRFGHTAGKRLGARSRDLRNRARGIAARMRREKTSEPPADDVLEARVRAGIGREVPGPGAIHVSARRGRVTLTGPVPGEKKEALVGRVQAVEGVDEVEDRLEPHESLGEISELAGSRGPRSGTDRGQKRFESENG